MALVTFAGLQTPPGVRLMKLLSQLLLTFPQVVLNAVDSLGLDVTYPYTGPASYYCLSMDERFPTPSPCPKTFPE